jgi:TorA maturation chaperone TorD
VDAALQRSRLYGLLRRVSTHEVDESLLAWCRDQGPLGLWSELAPNLAASLESADPETTLEELALDFCRLFITSGTAGSPHESVHRDGEKGNATGSLWGDPASMVKDFCREAGFEIAETAHLLPDHLGVELELMERLSNAEAVANSEGSPDEVGRLQELQRRMLDEHLSQWVPEYGRRLASSANTVFYREILDLLADFVDWEAQTRKEADRAAEFVG